MKKEYDQEKREEPNQLFMSHSHSFSLSPLLPLLGFRARHTWTVGDHGANVRALWRGTSGVRGLSLCGRRYFLQFAMNLKLL